MRSGQQTRPEQRKSPPAFFATTLPGLGGLLRQEIEAHPDFFPVDDPGHDGRSDIVFFRMQRGAQSDLRELRLAEDVFVVLAHSGRGSPRAVSHSLVTKIDLERALSVWAVRRAPDLVHGIPGDRSGGRREPLQADRAP